MDKFRAFSAALRSTPSFAGGPSPDKKNADTKQVATSTATKPDATTPAGPALTQRTPVAIDPKASVAWEKAMQSWSAYRSSETAGPDPATDDNRAHASAFVAAMQEVVKIGADYPAARHIAEQLAQFLEAAPVTTLSNEALELLAAVHAKANLTEQPALDVHLVRACSAVRTHYAAGALKALMPLSRAAAAPERLLQATATLNADVRDVTTALNVRTRVTWLADAMKIDAQQLLSVAPSSATLMRVFGGLAPTYVGNSASWEDLADALATLPVGTPAQGPLQALAGAIAKIPQPSRQLTTWLALSNELAKTGERLPHLGQGLIDKAGAHRLLEIADAATPAPTAEDIARLVQLCQSNADEALMEHAIKVLGKLYRQTKPLAALAETQAAFADAAERLSKTCTLYGSNADLPSSPRASNARLTALRDVFCANVSNLFTSPLD